MECTKCNFLNKKYSRFCLNCGENFDADNIIDNAISKELAVKCSKCFFINNKCGRNCLYCGQSLALDDFVEALNMAADKPADPWGSNKPHNSHSYYPPNNSVNGPLPSPGILATRSNVMLVQVIIYGILAPGSLALTLLFLLTPELLTWGIMFIFSDLYVFGWFVFYCYWLAKLPSKRIEFDGSNLTFYVTRNKTIKLHPSEITNITPKGGNWFTHGLLFIADGSITIRTKHKVFSLSFVKQSIYAAEQLRRVCPAATSNQIDIEG